MATYNTTIKTVKDDDYFEIFTDVLEHEETNDFNALERSRIYAMISLDRHDACYILSVTTERRNK